MKLDESVNLSFNKRKWEYDHTDRKSKKSVWHPKIVCDIDVLQALVRETKSNQGDNRQSRRGLHATTYPINCDPIDGVSPNHYMMQTRRASCSRCLQGEPGHFRHIIEK